MLVLIVAVTFSVCEDEEAVADELRLAVCVWEEGEEVFAELIFRLWSWVGDGLRDEELSTFSVAGFGFDTLVFITKTTNNPKRTTATIITTFPTTEIVPHVIKF